MRLDITGRHVDITPAIRQLIERRLTRLERLLNDSIVSTKVILTLEKYRHRVEIIVHARGDNTLRGLGEGNAWPLSVRQAVEKLEQQAEKIKTKWAERKRSDPRRRVPRTVRAGATLGHVRGGGIAVTPLDRTDGGESTARRVIRATRYAVKPMSVEDAVMRLDDATESFVVFRNAESESGVSIVYRRRDGNVGLIEPD